MANGPGYIESFLASEISQEMDPQQNKQDQLSQKAFNVLQSSLYSDPNSEHGVRFNQEEAIQKLEILEKTSLDPQFKTSSQHLLESLKTQLVDVHSAQELKAWVQQQMTQRVQTVNQGIHVQLSSQSSPPVSTHPSEAHSFHKKKPKSAQLNPQSEPWATRLLKKIRGFFSLR